MPLHAPTGPVAWADVNGAGGGKADALAAARFSARLRVVPREALPELAGVACAAYHPADGPEEGPADGAFLFLQRAGGADLVLAARPHPAAPRGSLALDAAERASAHLALHESYPFTRYLPPPGSTLAEIELEVRPGDRPVTAAPLLATAPGEPWAVDGAAVARALQRIYHGRVLVVNQLLPLTLTAADVDPKKGGGGRAGGAGSGVGVPLILRVASADVLDAAEREEAVGYHSYRGILSAGTHIFLAPAPPGPKPVGGQAAAAPATVHLVGGGPGGAAPWARAGAAPSRGFLDVITSDGEIFRVRRRLLRPCIALTGAVRDGSEATEVHVAVDTLLFDKVLLYLEAEALQQPLPEHDIRVSEELLGAAKALGLRALEARCAARLGEHAARLRRWSLAEVRARNDAGEAILIIDGMILDVTRWLPEHPGGSVIIPEQSLNIEAGRFFELYHSSRESFLYLKHFYVGELRARDLPNLPQPEPRASEDFLAQLRQYADFRLPRAAAGGEDEGENEEPPVKTFKSF